MLETNRTQEKAEPIPTILANLTELILSNELHDNQGAAIAAQFIADQEDISPRTYNLVSLTRRVAWHSEAYDDITGPIPDEVPKLKAHTARALGAIILPLLPWVRNTRKSETLFQLAAYKVERSYNEDASTVRDDFTAAIEAAPLFRRYLLKKSEITQFYRNLLNQTVPTSHDLKVIKNLMPIVRSSRPLDRIGYLLDQRGLNKAIKRREVLEANFAAVTKVQTYSEY